MPTRRAMRIKISSSVCLLSIPALFSCSGAGDTPTTGSGGANIGGNTSVTSSQGGAAPGAGSTGGTTGQTPASGGNSSRGGATNPSTGGTTSASGGSANAGGVAAVGGTSPIGTTSTATGGSTAKGGTSSIAGTSSLGGTTPAGGTGTTARGGSTSVGGASSSTGGTTAKGGTTAIGGSSSSSCSGPVGTISGPLATGVDFRDTAGNPVNAHGGGIIQEGDTFYMHGEYFLSTTTDNNFNGFSMYSSKDMATWKNEGIILPQQPSGLLGPNRKGERPHIIKCPATGEFVLYAHAADVTYQADKEVVYATSATVNGQYSLKGSLTNASGTIAAHSDMGAFVDGANAYVVTESGHVYQLATDCHSWLTDKVYSTLNGDSGGVESPAVFKAGNTYYWIGSYKTGWRANNNFYSTAPAMTGPWTYQGFVAPVTDTANNLSDQRTWLSQSTWVQPIQGCQGTTYVYWGDHWNGNLDTTAPGKHNNLATYVFQPLVFNGIKISMPTYLATWKLDVGAGTWSQ